MGAMLNGMAVHGGVHPCAARSWSSDYMRGATGVSSATMYLARWSCSRSGRTTVWVGEDGLTTSPSSTCRRLRSIPGLVVLRPADANETAAAWHYAS